MCRPGLRKLGLRTQFVLRAYPWLQGCAIYALRFPVAGSRISMTAAPRSRMCPFILSLLEFANHLLKSFFLAHVVGEVVPRALPYDCIHDLVDNGVVQAA
jgi:hypothetical protein